MPKNLNRFEVIGRLGDFPEMRYTGGGLEVTRISLGVSNDRYDKETEEWEERTDWIPVTFFGFKAANIAERYNKGDKLMVVARVSNNQYEKEGVTIYTFNFVGESYEFLAPGNYTRDAEEEEEDEDGMGDYPPGGEEEEEEVKKPPKKSRKKTRKATPKKVEEDDEPFDDDDDEPPF